MSTFFKILAWTILFLIVIVFVASAALPSWISSPMGSRTVIKWINNQINGQLSVEKIDVNWFGKQRLEGFKLIDKEGKPILQFDLFETKTALFYLVFGGRSLGNTQLTSPYLQLSKLEKLLKEETNETEKQKKKTTWLILPSFSNNLLIEKGEIVLEPQENRLIALSEIHLTVHESQLNFHALTKMESGEGQITINASLAQNLHITAFIQELPLELLDNLLETKLFTEALGPSLNLDFNLEKNGQEGGISLQGSANSANMTAYIEGITEQNNFSIDPKSHLTFTITPALFKELIGKGKRGVWDLVSKTTLSLKIEKAFLPLRRPLDFKAALVQATATLSRAEIHHALLGSFSLKQFEANITTLNNLEVALLGEIQGKESTHLAATLSLSSDMELLFNYSIEGFPVTLLELISDTLEQKVRTLFGPKFDLTAQGQLIDGVLASQFSILSPDTKIQGKLEGRYPELHFELEGNRTIFGKKAKIMGEQIFFALSGQAKLQDHSFALPYFKGVIYNPFFDMELNGQIGEEGKPFSFNLARMSALGTIKKIALEEGVTLENGTFFLQLDGAKNSLNGRIEAPLLKGSFDLRDFIQNEDLDFAQLQLFFNFDLNEFPTGFASPFVSPKLDLPLLLGKTITLSAKGSYTPNLEPHIVFDLNAQATGFTANLSIALDGTLSVKQNRPSYVYWEMTPERYEGLMALFHLSAEQKPTFTLTRPTQLELNITQFICPTSPTTGISHFLCQSGFVGDLSLSTTIFRNQQTNESITFQDINGSIQGENFSRALNLSLSGQIAAPNVPKEHESTFAFVGKMTDLLTKEGKLNREQVSLHGELSVHLLPVRQLTGIFPFAKETRSIIQAVLGELVNARLSGEISQSVGPINIDIKSSNAQALLALQLDKNVLYLRDRVNAEISLTEAVNETFLKEINPLIITGAYSNHPLKISIDSEGFVFPIRPFSLEKCAIGKAVVDIGRIQVRNGGQIQSLMEFLQTGQISPTGQMEAWFTPIYMSLHNGVASYSRFDALLGSNVHIAMWGSINLINDKVHMTLAIAPSTLSQRFKISGLSHENMFQVKMRGTTSKLDLDWSSAKKRIAILVTRAATGQIGSLVGGLLEKILLPSLGEEPVPPPTAVPLPWENFPLTLLF